MRAPTDNPAIWLDELQSHAAIVRAMELIDSTNAVTVKGRAGSSTVIMAAALSQMTDRPILLVTAHLDDADEAVDELVGLGVHATRFAAIEMSQVGLGLSLDLIAERLGLLRRAAEHQVPSIVVSPIQALMQRAPAAEELSGTIRVIRVGDRLETESLFTWLDEFGYDRVETLESPGEYAVRGGIIDLFPLGTQPCRLDLFGDEVDSLHEIDLDTMASDRRLDEVELIGARPDDLQTGLGTSSLFDYLPETVVTVLDDMLELTEQARSYHVRVTDTTGVLHPEAQAKEIVERSGCVVEVHQVAPGGEPEREVDLPVSPLPVFAESAADAIKELVEIGGDRETRVLCQNDGEAQRLGELLAEHAPSAAIRSEIRYLHRGVAWAMSDDRPGLLLVPYHELMNRFQTRRRLRRLSGGKAMDTFLDLQAGDFVVHRDHGIAKFIGLQSIADSKSGASEEFLTLEFAKGAKLHVPATRIDLVQRYVGAHRGRPELSTMGGKRWSNQKNAVKEAVRDLAAEMLRIQAARESLPGITYPADTIWQNEFEAEFPYEETEDQVFAIEAVKTDMSGRRPMDRLICGDVGFGKTEVAIRAAFKAAEFGKQVAVLVPTTVLAEQHERSFRMRFSGYPFVIESLSRFKTRKEQTEILKRVAKGQVDVIIGTHRLLSADVKFADLGLVIIDEEQRFGVEHKHKLLEFRATADVLTLSATPIPRTLHMAMLGLRDISSLSTAPMDRRAIVTEVMTFDKRRVQAAIERELAREGQVFFVHNRVHNIHDIASEIQALVPDANIIVGHGQMPAKELEKVMLRFVRRQADILVSTTIIESGIDIPTANTMFINDADRFGLSELHQLRGRVGRHKHRAYCYLLLDSDKTINPVAVKRLRAIEAFSMLGAGFRIAMRDLEIRGAGNLLGAEQSGHISAVGYEMYCQLLHTAVEELKNPRRRADVIDTNIDIGITGHLPKGYIPSDTRRMDAYRRICQCSTFEELETIEHDLKSAYGELAKSASRLVQLAEIRIGATMADVSSIRRHELDIVFRSTNPRRVAEIMGGAKGTVRIVTNPDDRNDVEVYYRPPKSFFDGDSLLTVLRRRLRAGVEAAGDLVTQPG